MGTAAVQVSAVGAEGITFPANSNRFVRFGSGAYISASAVEFQGQIRNRVAGVWSNVWIRVTVNTRDGSTVCRSRIDGANGNQVATIPATTTGFFEDTSNTDTLSGGELINYLINSTHSVATQTGFQTSIIQSIFTADAAERVYRLVSGLQTSHGSGFIPMMGGSGTYGVAAPYQIHVPGGTIRNSAIRVTSNARNGTTTLTLNVNGVDTALTVSIAAATTGWFEDTVNTVTVFDRDKCIWNHTLGGTSGFYTAQHQMADLVTDAFFGGGTRDGSGIVLKGSGLPAEIDGAAPLTGWHDPNILADEAFSQHEALVTDNWNGVICYIDVNGQDTSCEFRSRKNGSDDSLTVTIPALTTGVFESTGSATALTPTDLISLRRLTNASNPDSLIYYTHTIFGEESAPPPVLPALGGIYKLTSGKTNDTVYTGFGPPTTRNVAIP